MIKRIKSISQVGLFSNFPNGASLGFGRLTFIYGFNGYGKSTICDIFKSLSKSEAALIEGRRSIPGDSNAQRIKISVSDGESEKLLEFKNGRWDANNYSKRIEVFNTNFMYDNVFTGMSIERKNKENLTEFILGAESVAIARELENCKKSLGENKRRIKEVIPAYVRGKGVNEVKNFVDLVVEKAIIDLKEEKLKKETEKKHLEVNQKNRSTLLLMKEPLDLVEPSFEVALKELYDINRLLQKDFEDLNEKALSKLRDHIKENLGDSADAEEWVHKGLLLSGLDITDSAKNCPFCGRSLLNGMELISTYQAYFNIEYTKFIDDLNKEVKNDFRRDLNKQLSNVLLICKDYSDKLKDANYNDLIGNLETIKSEVDEKEDALESKLKEIRLLVRDTLNDKKKNPSKKRDSINTSDLEAELFAYLQLGKSSQAIISKLRVAIVHFKAKQELNKSNLDISKLQKDIEGLERAVCRLEQNSQCESYRKLCDEISIQEKKIVDLEERLSNSQAAYLSKYFRTINHFFKRLGSEDFAIDVSSDSKGHKPVYSLVVKYKDQRIKDSELPYVFSESDRRALALSIFWTNLVVKDEVERQNTIVVLDDPVTSFDDNRITIAVNLFKTTSEKISQIIILTHYGFLLKRFTEIFKDAPCSCLQISRDSGLNSNCLTSLNIGEFTQSEYQKKFSRIHRFANGVTCEDVRMDFRPFLEVHLKMLFNKQLEEFGLSNSMLAQLIEGLYLNTVIDNNTKEKLHYFRNTLNPDSHTFTNYNIEDARVLGKELLDYLYSIRFFEEQVF